MSPAASKVNPEPATKSLTLDETSTSDGPAFAATRALIEIVSPASLPSIRSHFPGPAPLTLLDRPEDHVRRAELEKACSEPQGCP
jgi:hypothetical protein